MQYVSFYAWCCRRAEQTRHCITKRILMPVIWQMQQRVVYSLDLIASLLSAYLPAKPMDVMIQVLSCILLFFSMPIAPAFYLFVTPLSWCVASLGPVLRCVVVCSRVLHPKMQQSLKYSGCPLVVVLLQSISMTLAPVPFCPFVFYWTCDLSPLIWSLVDEIILHPVPVHMDWKLHLWVCKCLLLWNAPVEI